MTELFGSVWCHECGHLGTVETAAEWVEKVDHHDCEESADTEADQ